jgi:hypothetical protein
MTSCGLLDLTSPFEENTYFKKIPNNYFMFISRIITHFLFNDARIDHLTSQKEINWFH